MSQEYSLRHIDTLDDISQQDWNALTGNSNPFVRYEYLHGLEHFDCLNGHGWTSRHIAVYSERKLVGALPLYLRSNSYGEFVFDWSWADAYERAGGRYYPKLVSAIPFAPVVGPRLLVSPDIASSAQIKEMLLQGALCLAKDLELSSYHSLFTENHDHDFFLNAGMMSRKTCQFHWHNDNYENFEMFLDSLKSKKRKQIRRERKELENSKIQISVLNGDQVSDEQWSVYYNFYCSTFYRRWGSPRLTLEFFKHLGASMPDKTILILAAHKNKYVAGSFIMAGGNTLYGRHWGCDEHYRFLHFELCYYQTIEYCIKYGYQVIDAGVQGEHKLARGFHPVTATSFHWIRHPVFRNAIDEYLLQEKREIDSYVNLLNTHLPFKHDI
jgi:predicted N-acyltransferase